MKRGWWKRFEIRGRATRMSCIVFSCLAIYGSTRVVLGNDPLFARKVASFSDSIQHWSPVSEGTDFPKNLSSVPVKSGKIILIAVNSCIKCSFSKLVAADILGYVLKDQDYTVVFVTQDTENNIDMEFADHGKPKYCKIICDPGKLIIKELGSTKTPQFVVFENRKSIYSGQNSMFISTSITDWLKSMDKNKELEEINKISRRSDKSTLHFTGEEPCDNKTN